ncbi:hypothetical protein EVAR_55167_1 [Eumeta japonica]|uniref:Uncharacterized protein n=1 Tax=Eumeta variegata TaxID=151549 RepID=A0A4C1Y5H5_EUMVA|nr:hypothetical protein EVAR_55167_1 [Eumeta japonica]
METSQVCMSRTVGAQNRLALGPFLALNEALIGSVPTLKNAARRRGPIRSACATPKRNTLKIIGAQALGDHLTYIVGPPAHGLPGSLSQRRHTRRRCGHFAQLNVVIIYCHYASLPTLIVPFAWRRHAGPKLFYEIGMFCGTGIHGM